MAPEPSVKIVIFAQPGEHVEVSPGHFVIMPANFGSSPETSSFIVTADDRLVELRYALPKRDPRTQ